MARVAPRSGTTAFTKLMRDDTRENRTFEQWLDDCSSWWDMTIGEEARDYPWLAWRAWYDAGLTVEEAVQRANREVFGGR